MHRHIWARAAFLGFVVVFSWAGLAPGADKIARLRNDLPRGHLQRFKDTVEAQARKYPDIFFLESLRDEPKIALTFDDGPDEEYTPRVLAILKKHEAKGTFFLVGYKIRRFPDIVRDIVHQGHAVGGHSFDHADLRKLTLASADAEISKTQDALENCLKFRPSIFRPPYGAVTDGQIEAFGRRGLKIIDWSIDSCDWDRKHNQAGAIAALVHLYRHPGAIVLMHAAGPAHRGTLEALPAIIEQLKSEGYELVTVPELLHVPADLPPSVP